MKSVTFILLVGISLVSSQSDVFTAAEYTDAFNNWKSTYGVQYSSSAQESTAFENFKSNVDSIRSEPATEVSSDVNPYSGMKPSEFIASHTGFNPALAPAIAAAVVLGTGAIIGIAVGGAAAVGIAGGAIAGGVIYAKKKREANSDNGISMESRHQPRVDLLAPKNDFTSITARAVPQAQN